MSQLAAPSLADVQRFGNLLLQAWAPPTHPLLAPAWLDETLGRFIGAGAAVLLLGHRPGTLRTLPPQVLTHDIQALLAALTPDTDHAGLHRLPPAVAQASLALLRPGELHIRQKKIDKATGLTRPVSTHLGRLLLLSSTSAALQVLQQVLAKPPLQLSLSCLTNPWAGLRQPDATWLRSIKAWPGDALMIGWRGNALQLLTGREALPDLRTRLIDRLAAA